MGSKTQSDFPLKLRLLKIIWAFINTLHRYDEIAVIFLLQELGGKMVICIAFSLVCLYLCLLIRTFEPDSVGGMSKSNSACIFLGKPKSIPLLLRKVISETSFLFTALATYFFTLSTLGWMSAMSYNIMSTFG